ncbi:MAG TPA: DUF6263 family protein [Gemmatimonadota bacterium]|nr:DUF6263 family protein [Gemmatimonadota bacterium]
MRRDQRKSIVALALAAILAPFCGTAAAVQQDAAPLRLQFEPGRTFTMEMTLDQQISQTLFGQEQQMTQVMEMTYGVAVEGVDAAGNGLVNWTYDAVRFEVNGPMGRLVYDSADPTAEVSPLLQGYAAFVGRSFRARTTPRGKVLEVSGFEEILQALLQDMELPPGPEADAVRAQLEAQLGDQAMQELLTRMLAVYPDGPVAIGESWGSQLSVTSGYPMTVDATYTLNERRSGLAIIGVAATVQSTPGAPPMEMYGMNLSFDLAGDQAGTIEVDLESGWVVRGELQQNFSGQVSVSGGQAGEGMQWPMAITGTMKLQSR